MSPTLERLGEAECPACGRVLHAPRLLRLGCGRSAAVSCPRCGAAVQVERKVAVHYVEAGGVVSARHQVYYEARPTANRPRSERP